MSKSELEAETEAALNQGGEPAPASEMQGVITNENALPIIAQTLIAIEKHLFALVYLENTKDSAKTGFTYVPEVFRAIYDGTDPFAEAKAESDAQAKAGDDA